MTRIPRLFRPTERFNPFSFSFLGSRLLLPESLYTGKTRQIQGIFNNRGHEKPKYNLVAICRRSLRGK